MIKLRMSCGLLLLMFLLPCCVIAQDTANYKGIRFENRLSFETVKAKAKAENKIIFLDCYATWCVPCKQMEQDIYKLAEVGDYFNSHFISVKLQMDKTAFDTEEVKSWYKAADSLKKVFDVSEYPTFIFLDAGGVPLHRMSGTSATGQDFINGASASISPETQYYTLVNEWKMHTTDSLYLLNALMAVKKAGDNENAGDIALAYIASLNHPVTLTNIDLLSSFIWSEESPAFHMFLKNSYQINKLKGNGYTERLLASVIFNAEARPLFERHQVKNWKLLSEELQRKYNNLDQTAFSNALDQQTWILASDIIKKMIPSKKIIKHEYWLKINLQIKHNIPGANCNWVALLDEMQYDFRHQLWHESAVACMGYIDIHGSQMTPNSINDNIYNFIFLHCDDAGILKWAVTKMSSIVRANPKDNDDIDTYANLLYKTGAKQAGIDWERKALTLAPENKDISARLRQMEDGTLKIQ